MANAVLTPNGGRGVIDVGTAAFSENHRGGCSLGSVAEALTGGGGKPGEGYRRSPIIRGLSSDCGKLA
jgi:hypothetical protein